MSDERGLYWKYEVYKHGKPLRGWCFVIEEDDPAAPEVLRLYAEYAESKGNRHLVQDLIVKADELEAAARRRMGRQE